jgi:multiple sugar transport system permease protein
MSEAASAAHRPRRGLRAALTRPETRWAYVFLLPWIIGFIVFTAGPMIASFALSLTNYDVINPPTFAGLANYERMLRDPQISRSLYNTAFYTLLYVPLSMALALGLAIMLNRVGRLAGFFRTVFYLPSVTPAVAVGALFLFLLNPHAGLVNRALEAVGISGPAWTTDPTWVKPGIILITLWSLGSTVVIYLASLRNVPGELYEAARIDGAGAWAQFRHVTLPMISGALFFTLVVNTIASLQIFAEVYTMYFGNRQDQAGGAADAALFYSILIFNEAFRYFRMGYASALAWLLFVVILVITVVQLRLARRWVYYAGE